MQQTAAYDLNMYARSARRTQREGQERLRVEKTEKRVALRRLWQRAQFVVLCAVALGLICSVLVAQSTLTELGGQIGDMQSELTELRSEYDYLNNQLEMQTNLTEVENYARTELGLVKMDKSQITYVAGNEEARVVRQASGFQQFLQHITGGFLSFMSYLDP